MSHLTEADIRKIAKLARIRLSDDEINHFTGELSSILDWVEQLQEVNTDGVDQMVSVAKMDLPMREDSVTVSDIHEDILANAPNSEYDCFLVPKVVE